MEPIIYEPNKYLKLGIRIWPQMVRELIDSRELTWRMFVRDVSARYKQTALGFVWAVIMPFIAIGTFVFLSKVGIMNIGPTDVPYPLFALIGLSIWQLFSTGLTSGCNSIVGAGSLISKINFPREVLVFSSMAQSIFEFLIKFCLIIVFFFVFRFKPSLAIIFFPLALVPILVLTVGLSLVLSLINCVLRDTANAVTLLITFLMFLVPVLYPISSERLFFKLDPLLYLINGPRDLIIYGHIQEPVGFFIATTVSFLIFLTCWRMFHLVETKIPERL